MIECPDERKTLIEEFLRFWILRGNRVMDISQPGHEDSLAGWRSGVRVLSKCDEGNNGDQRAKLHG